MRHNLLLWATVGFLISCGEEKKGETRVEYVERPSESSFVNFGTCLSELEDQCRELEEQLKHSRAKLDAAIQGDDADEIRRIQIEINELYEILTAYSEGQEDVSEIKGRYQALRDILNSNSLFPANINYLQTELDAVKEVFKDFGELYIQASPLGEDGNPQMEEPIVLIGDERPWTGYWYPKSKPYIFEGEDSPLAKFDRYLESIDRDGKSAEWEELRWRPDMYASWEGLCDALAFAAVMTNEPRYPLNINDVEFSAVDLKALALKYYEGYEPKIYGLRYDGTSLTDGEMQDIRPEAFHRIIEVVLGERGQPVIIDSDPGPEVWAKTIYRYSWVVKEDPDYDNAFLVTGFPTMLNQRARLPSSDEESLTDYFRDSMTPKYEYRLYVDPENRRGNKMKVIAGEWINGSLDNHPDMVFIPQSPYNENQTNRELRKYHEELRNLLIHAGVIPDGPSD